MLEDNKNKESCEGERIFQSESDDSLFDVHNLDARNLDAIIKEAIVDVTITSPPYFDLKDYGHDSQIGYGQKYEDYLNDLSIVFSKVHKVTKDSGSLWVVIDSFKKDGDLVPLPFDFVAKLKSVGWKLQDVIIWRKDKTVPWVNGGVTRSIFEYVLHFSKSNAYKYYKDRVRDYKDLKKWWVKYPERYHPKGKSLDEVWEFPIPIQGSWGDGYIRHFCPLPESLVDRILQLTTDENDVVLDPFSGSGTVPAIAQFSNRKHIGFELNSDYIKMFRDYVKANSATKQLEFSSPVHKLRETEAFEKLILDLRALKLARVIKKELKIQGLDIKSIFVDHISMLTKAASETKFAKASFVVLIEHGDLNINIKEIISSSKAINKFRLEVEVSPVLNRDAFKELLPDQDLYIYAEQSTHKYKAVSTKADFNFNSLILSPIKVSLNESDYE